MRGSGARRTPAGIASVPGGLIYVTEVFTAYDSMTPLGDLSAYGIAVPNVLYSIAYF